MFCVYGRWLRPGQWDGQTSSPPSSEPSAFSTGLHITQPPPGHQVAAASRPHDLPGETQTAGSSPHAPPSVYALRDNWNPLSDHPSTPVLTPQDVRSALQWWSSPPHHAPGGPLAPPLPQLQLFTDASTEGLGAHLTSHQTSGTWSPRQRSLHINNLIWNCWQFTSHFSTSSLWSSTRSWYWWWTTPRSSVRSRTRAAHTHDPCTTRLSSSSGRTADASLWSHATSRDTWTWLPTDHQLRVDTVSADTPPCAVPMGLAPCRPLCHIGNHPSAHVRLSISGPGSVEDRPLVLSVEGSMGLYVSTLSSHPRGSPEDTGVQLPRHPSGSIAWPSQPWFPRLLSMLDDHLRPLPPRRTLLRQLRSWIFHPDPSRLSLHGRRLSSRPSSAEAIPRRWQPTLPCHTASLHNLSVTASGASSLSGAETWDMIHSLPLLRS